MFATNNISKKNIISNEELNEWVINWLILNVDAARKDISLSMSFSDFGMDSVKCLELAHDLENKACVTIDPTVAWQTPTIGELITLVCKKQTENIQTPEKPKAAEKETISDDELMSLIFG